MKYAWMVIEPGIPIPKCVGVFTSEKKAEETAYKDSKKWRNVIRVELDKEKII